MYLQIPLVLPKYLSELTGVFATCSSTHVNLRLLRSFLQAFFSFKSFCKWLIFLLKSLSLPKSVTLMTLTISWLSLDNYSRSLCISYFFLGSRIIQNFLTTYLQLSDRLQSSGSHPVALHVTFNIPVNQSLLQQTGWGEEYWKEQDSGDGVWWFF